MDAPLFQSTQPLQQQSMPLQTALQQLAQFFGQNRNPMGNGQRQVQNIGGQPDQQPAGQGGTSLSDLFKTGVADVTGLPWLSDSSGSNALAALQNLFKNAMG